MKYTISDFNTQFPDDDACLDHVFKSRYPKLKGYKKVKNRLAYGNSQGHQIYPLVGTAFERSTTPLKLWFFAAYLFGQSRNGVSAKELQRQLGVTYKCAWRMANRIRATLKPDSIKLKGIVECDEAYIGGKRRLETRRSSKNKTPVFGMVERGGKVHAQVVKDCSAWSLIPVITKNVRRKSKVITDGWRAYNELKHARYTHKSVNHNKWEYVRKEGKLSVNTNTIENFWSHLKRQINGTHHFVAPRYLSDYVNEVSFRYNHRHSTEPMFLSILKRTLV